MFSKQGNVAAVVVLVATLVAPAARPQQDAEAGARAFFGQLAGGQFEQAAAKFDERVAAAVPVARLSQIWQAYVAQVGAFHEVTEATRSEAQGLTVIALKLKFESGTVPARLAFDAQGRVAGLWFGAPEMPWSPAASVKADTFTERAVTIGSAPWQLPGILALPKGAGPFPAVVLVHGSGPNDQDETVGANKPFKDLAWGLASRGIAVLRYEKRTKKYPREFIAAGRFTVQEETVEDAQHAVDVLATVPGVDAKRVYVAGHSLGAMLAPRIAAGNTHVAGIIVMASNTRPLEELLVEQLRYIAGADGQISEAEQKQIEAAERTAQQIRDPNLKPDDVVNMVGVPIPGAYFLGLRNYTPAEAAAALKVPVLVLQGERDYQVRMADFEGWRKALQGRRDTFLKSYPALNHLFVAGSGPSVPMEYARLGHVADEVLDDIARWILGPETAAPRK